MFTITAPTPPHSGAASFVPAHVAGPSAPVTKMPPAPSPASVIERYGADLNALGAFRLDIDGGTVVATFGDAFRVLHVAKILREVVDGVPVRLAVDGPGRGNPVPPVIITPAMLPAVYRSLPSVTAAALLPAQGTAQRPELRVTARTQADIIRLSGMLRDVTSDGLADVKLIPATYAPGR